VLIGSETVSGLSVATVKSSVRVLGMLAVALGVPMVAVVGSTVAPATPLTVPMVRADESSR